MWKWKSKVDTTIEKSWTRVVSGSTVKSVLYDMVKYGGVVKFTYKGVERVGEVWCLGKSTKSEVVRVWIRSGSKSMGSTFKGWRLFRVGEIEELSWTGEWLVGSRAGYNPSDKGMVEIEISADPEERVELQKGIVGLNS